MTEKEITCQQRDDLIENNQPVSVYSSLTNFVGGEILDPRLPGHTATTWCDEGERPFLREILDAEGCRHWAITQPENVECRTCDGFREVFASRDVERPELDRWYACPDCTTPENVEEPT